MLPVTTTTEPQPPLAKRRKTIIQETDEAEPIREKREDHRNVKGASPESTTDSVSDLPTACRELPLGRAQQPPTAEVMIDVEDSFVRAVKPRKRARPKATTQDIEGVAEAHVVSPLVKGKSSRRAAVDAESKNTEGFAVEAAPVDTLKRDVAPVKPARGRRKTQEDAIAVIEAAAIHEAESLLATQQSPRKSKSRSKPDRKKGAKPPAIIDDVKILEVKPIHAESTDPHASRTNTEAKAKPIRSGCRTKKAIGGPQTVEPIDDVRRPLADADANITLRSLSPEKHESTKEQSPAKATITRSRKRTETGSRPVRREAIQNKRRKLKVQPDDVLPAAGQEMQQVVQEEYVQTVATVQLVVHQHALPTPPRSSGVADQHPTADTVTSPIFTGASPREEKNASDQEDGSGLSRAAVKRKATPNASGNEPTRKVAGRKRLHAETELAATIDNEEDIDWLFAPVEPKRPVPVTAKVMAKGKMARSKRLTDIDLDDLLLNVAAFDEIQQSVGTGRVEKPVSKQAAVKPKARRR